jgi:hypothetical protein
MEAEILLHVFFFLFGSGLLATVLLVAYPWKPSKKQMEQYEAYAKSCRRE